MTTLRAFLVAFFSSAMTAGALLVAAALAPAQPTMLGATYPTPSGNGIPIVADGHYLTEASSGDAGQYATMVDGSVGWGSVPADNTPITDVDCDLTAQTPVTVNTDTTFTMCGITFAQVNSANADGGTTLSDAGFRMIPKSATNISGGTLTAVYVRAPLVNIIPGYTLNMPWSFDLNETDSTAAANFDQAGGGVMIYNAAYNNQLTLLYWRGYSGATNGYGVQDTILQSNVVQTATSIPFATSTTAEYTLPAGAFGAAANLFVGTYDGGWPVDTDGGLGLIAEPTPSASSSAAFASSSSGLHGLPDLNFFIYALRANSTTNTFAPTWSRLRIRHWPLGR